MKEEKLHSHSGLERELMMPKHKVLVDFKFAPMFDLADIGDVFERNGKKYAEVETKAFIKFNGVFKNLDD